MFVQIVDDVREWLATRDINAIVDEGVEARNSQINFGDGAVGRVVFVPSDAPMTLSPPAFFGEDDAGKRQLLNAMFAFDVSIAGYDATAPRSDLAQRRMCLALFEAVIQGVQRSYYGAHEWGPARWTLDRKHLARGAELVVPLTLNVPLFDTEAVVATPEPVAGSPKPKPET